MAEPALRLEAVESADVRGEMTRLRPMRPDEAPQFYAWATDPEVQPFWGGRDHYTDLDDFVSDRHWGPHYFDGSQPDRGRCFTIESLPAGRVTDCRSIGMVAYNRINVPERNTEIDIVVGEPGYRDRGYGTDAVRAFLGFLFDTIGLHRVWLATYDCNVRAQRAYEKAGFRREGVMRQADRVDGRWVDAVIYGVLEHEFRST
jgi:RimJ/RimL family protein N-acetyltransferase